MKFVRNMAIAAAMALPLTSALSQTWPTRPITIVVPTSPGGVLSNTARIVAQKLHESLGQPVVVDHKAGANGEIGAMQVVRAAPDGHTLLIAIANPMGKFGRGLFTDLQPIGLVADGGQLALMVPSSSPAKNVRELVDLMRADKSKANYTTSGAGYPAHITTELFKRDAKFDAQHIPMKGGGEAFTELLSGRMSFSFAAAVHAPNHLKTGRIRVLAVSSARRSPLLPDVPTMAEVGFPTITMPDFWMGVFAPKNTPKPVVERIAGALQALSNNEEFRGTLTNMGYVPSNLQLDAVTERVRNDADYWLNTATALKIQGPE